MNLNQLIYFRAVAKYRHFTKAAKELNVSQPSLSYAISNLEEELNTELFEKQRRTVVLTKYGKMFLDHVETALDELELGKREILKMTGAYEGHLDIAYLYPLAPRYIPKMVRSFQNEEQNGDSIFNFFQGITDELILGLKTQKYDVIFSALVNDEPDIEFIPIIEQELVVAVPLEHPLADRESVNLKEIEEYPLVAYSRETGLGKQTKGIFEAAGVQPNIISETENELAIYGLVAEDFGIALVSHIPEIANYKVKAIPVDGNLCTYYIYLAYMKNRYLSPLAKRFIDYVKQAEGIEI